MQAAKRMAGIEYLGLVARGRKPLDGIQPTARACAGVVCERGEGAVSLLVEVGLLALHVGSFQVCKVRERNELRSPPSIKPSCPATDRRIWSVSCWLQERTVFEAGAARLQLSSKPP